jgi:hypothetical protein
MARQKSAAREDEEQPTNGQSPALATKGKARAAGNLDVIRAGNEKDAAAGKFLTENSKPLGKGLRAEVEKDFQLSEDDDAEDLVRVFDAHPDNKGEDIVLFSGSRQQAAKVHKTLGEFLKK